MTKKSKKKLNYRATCLFFFFLCFIFMIFGYFKFRSPFVSTYKLEAGDKLQIKDVVIRETSDAKFITKIDDDIIRSVGKHRVKVKSSQGIFEIIVEVKDTIAPKIVLKENPTLFIDDGVDVNDIIEKVEDQTKVDVSFEKKYTFSPGRSYDVTVVAKDAGGNVSKESTKVTVGEDTEPPVLNASVGIYINISDSVAYKKYLSVTDNRDSYDQLDIKVDASKVNLTQAGYYPLQYIVTDRAGNVSTANSRVVVKDRDDNQHKETATKLAKEYVEKISSTASGKEAKLKMCYDDLYDNFKRTGTHFGTLDAYYQDASYGFRTQSGDCLVMISMMRLICDELDIPYVPIIRTAGDNATNHYWMIADCGDGYYHYDVYRHQGNIRIFKYTDAALDEWNNQYKNLNAYNKNAYPARAK